MKYNNRYADKKLEEGVELEIEGGTVKDYTGEGINIIIPRDNNVNRRPRVYERRIQDSLSARKP